MESKHPDRFAILHFPERDCALTLTAHLSCQFHPKAWSFCLQQGSASDIINKNKPFTQKGPIWSHLQVVQSSSHLLLHPAARFLPSFDPFLFQVFLNPNSSVDSRHHGYFDQRQSYILSSFIIITVKALSPAPTTLDLPAATTEAKKRRVRAKILLQKFLENRNPLKITFSSWCTLISEST